jgi:uncharacterized protein (TIGR00725 family)
VTGKQTKENVAVTTPYVAVVGPGVTGAQVVRDAEEVGRLIAERGAVLVCGGLTGVMEAACRGAKSAGGTTVGILPGRRRSDANDWVDIAIATDLGEVRNALVVRAVDVVIAIAGEFGTLSEIALALKTGIPVVGLNTWELAKSGSQVQAIQSARSAREAVETAFQMLTAL